MMAAQPRLPALQLDALPTRSPPKLPSPDMLVAYGTISQQPSQYSQQQQEPPPPPPPPQIPHAMTAAENKRCGWCRTFDTPQWRLGQSSGSTGTLALTFF